VAVFILPLNSAVNPVLYTISTAPFLRHFRKRANVFRKSFKLSSKIETKHSYLGKELIQTGYIIFPQETEYSVRSIVY